jgi:hypothetical protein
LGYSSILYKKLIYSPKKTYNTLKTWIDYIQFTFLIILYIIAFTNYELLTTYRTLFCITTKMMNASREYSTNITWVISIFIICRTPMQLPIDFDHFHFACIKMAIFLSPSMTYCTFFYDIYGILPSFN